MKIEIVPVYFFISYCTINYNFYLRIVIMYYLINIIIYLNNNKIILDNLSKQDNNKLLFR
jgi:hypothetical protein